MAEQIRIVELPFSQLELVQLELFLNRERQADWVLVKVEHNKFHFEKRSGEAYCYQVRLHVTPQSLEENLLSVEEKQKRFVKEQEQAGWQFMGELHHWYIFRSLVERHPIIVERDWKEEYKQLRKIFFKKEVSSIAGRSLILLLLLMSVIFFSPMSFITSNYTLGIILACILLAILATLEIKVWLEFKYKMHMKIKAQPVAIADNEALIKESLKRRVRMKWAAGGALFVFWLSMILDGIFLHSWRMILMTMLIAGVCMGGFFEMMGEKYFIEKYTKVGRVLYMVCVASLLLVAIANGISNLQGTYEGKEAVQMKEEMKQLSLVTLDQPQDTDYIEQFSASKKQTSTLFLTHYVQYAEWQSDKYLCINYYEVRESFLNTAIFDFLLNVNQINSKNGYEAVDPKPYGVDEAYLGDYGRSIYLRKGCYIIEIPYTSEKLNESLWENKIHDMFDTFE